MNKKPVLKFLKSLALVISIIIFIDFFVVPKFFTFLLTRINFNYFCYEKADVLVLGDSHTERVLNSKLLGNKIIQNFSDTGRYLDLNNYIYKEYRDIFPAPEYIVLSTQLWMFKSNSYIGSVTSLNNKKYREEFINKRFFNYSNYFNRLLHLKFNLVENGSFISEAMWRYGLRLLKQKNHCISGQQDVFADGKNSNSIPNDLLDETRPYDREDYLTGEYSPYSSLNEINYGYFKMLLDTFQKDGVKVILYETPEFIGSTKSISNKVHFYKDIEKITQGYSNISFVKHNDLGVDEQDPSNFTDGGYGRINSHLSKKGATSADSEFIRSHLRFE